MTKQFIYALCMASALTACVEDEGTYGVNSGIEALNKVKISGIDSEYEAGIAYLDEFSIEPEIEGSVYGENLDNYEFTWYRCSPVRDGVSLKHLHDTLSHEKNLSMVADFRPGSHPLYFVVKDKNTGIEINQKTTIKTSSPFTRGLLIVGDRPGNGLVAIDMLSMVKRTGMPIDTLYIKDVIDLESQPLTGAKDLIYTGYYQPGYERFFLNCNEGSYRLVFNSENMLAVYNELNNLDIISTPTPHITPMRMVDIASRQGCQTYASGSIYPRFYMTQDLAFQCKPSGEFMTDAFNRYSSSSEEYYNFYPHFFYNTRKRTINTSAYTNSPILLYDTDHECFAYVTMSLNRYWSVNITDLPSSGVTVNNGQNGRHLIYAENDFAYPNSRVCTLVNSANGKMYISMFTPSYSQMGAQNTVVISGSERVIDTSIARDIEIAEKYHFSSYASQLYYAVGNTLYCYDYVNKRLDTEVLDGEITLIENATTPGGWEYDEFWVGTYDGTKGHLYKLICDNNQNETKITHMDNQDWEIDMKPVKVLWSNRGPGF